jgi:transcriptional regulator with XRE-family HTH domain
MEIEEQLDLIIQNIVQARHKKSISQLELAQRAELSQSFLANLESGKKQPSVMTLLKIAQALEINPGDLFPKVTQNKEQTKNEIINLLDSL